MLNENSSRKVLVCNVEFDLSETLLNSRLKVSYLYAFVYSCRFKISFIAILCKHFKCHIVIKFLNKVRQVISISKKMHPQT